MATDTTREFKAEVSDLLETLKRERDEIRVQLHLAQAEARDEWERMEKKWENFHGKAAAVGEVAAGASKDVGAAARVLGEELKKGYARIRKAIADQA
jgi:hypothetical protein